MRTPFRKRNHLVAAAVAGILVFAGTACEPEPPVPPPPPLTTLNCTASGTVTVNSWIAGPVRDLLAKAKADGVNMCGGGYRDSAGQIAARKANCGTTYYDIYEKPSGQCSPPTAIPGTSMHEQGLAIDFTNCTTQGTACFWWLTANASTYGLKNLPSEPWHWSTNGR